MTKPSDSRPNALHSLSGSKVAKQRRQQTGEGSALAGMVGGQERRQEVLTPAWVIFGLMALSGRIGLDPCTTVLNPCRARVFCTNTIGDDGLAFDWAASLFFGEFVYVNPPYGDLEPWIAKAALEALLGAPIWMLAPFRPNRPWFGRSEPRFYALKSFPFVGEKDPFPGPLCLIGWNVPELTSIKNDRGHEMRFGEWRFTP